MELRENKEERPRHVIEKIKRISLSVDRGESLNFIALAILFSVLVGGLVYYFLL